MGVTDQYLRGHISNAGYAVCYNEISGKVGSLNIQEKDGNECVGSIQQSYEPRFLLYRFWSLYESMMNSEFMVVRLGLMKKNSIISMRMIMNRWYASERIVSNNWCIIERESWTVL